MCMQYLQTHVGKTMDLVYIWADYYLCLIYLDGWIKYDFKSPTIACNYSIVVNNIQSIKWTIFC